jgi:hypothetical protein
MCRKPPPTRHEAGHATSRGAAAVNALQWVHCGGEVCRRLVEVRERQRSGLRRRARIALVVVVAATAVEPLASQRRVVQTAHLMVHASHVRARPRPVAVRVRLAQRQPQWSPLALRRRLLSPTVRGARASVSGPYFCGLHTALLQSRNGRLWVHCLLSHFGPLSCASYAAVTATAATPTGDHCAYRERLVHVQRGAQHLRRHTRHRCRVRRETQHALQ